jgi:RimJ/RimL family protein N-acetyltransferase
MHGPIPTLPTERLLLRPFTLADGPAVQALVGAPEVAATTLNIPHPYPDGAAETWIAGQPEYWSSGQGANWAITRRGDGIVLGSISLAITRRHRRAEMGYWLGVPYWNQGYTTEAARRVVAFVFCDLDLNRLQATCLPRNIASARVMQKAGLRYEGQLRGYIVKDDQIEDLNMYALTRADYEA